MTPVEAIASIRASIAAGYSPSLSDIEVLIAECGRVETLEGIAAIADKLIAHIEESEEHGEGADGTLSSCGICISIDEFRKAKATLTQAEEKGGG